MDEEQLKALLGENFDGAKDFFKNQVLGNGDYVSKGKAEAEKNDLQKKLNDLNSQLQAKMTDDEKKKADDEATRQLIEDLQNKLKAQTIKSNQSSAISNITEAMKLADIKADDQEFVKFVERITNEDETITNETSKYINTLVTSAYEKGKSEATKQNLGKIGNFNANNGNGSGSGKDSIATRLAKENSNKKVESSYFKN